MKKIASFKKISYIHLLSGIAICLAVYQIILGGVNADEVETLHTAWKMFTGESIYRDFFQHHHPLFYYLLIPVIAIGGETVDTFYLAELFTAGLWVGIVVTTYKLAGKIYSDRRIALLSMVLLLVFPWFIIRGTHIRPDTPQVLLGLLSFWFLVLAHPGRSTGRLAVRKTRYFLLSALVLSLSFLALQKAVFLIFAVGLILLYWLFFASGGTRMTMKDLLLYWAGFSLLPMLYVIYLFMVGDFRDYFDFNYLINMNYIHSFSVFSVVSRNMYVLLSMTGFMVLFVAGCFVRPPGSISAHWAIILTGICCIIGVFFARAPFQQYFLMATPFVCIVAAASLQHFFHRATSALILSILVLLCSVHLIKDTKVGRGKTGTIAAMEYVLEITEPEDVYFGYRMRNLFRRNADFFWFCFTPNKCLETLQSFRDYDWDPVQIIVQTRPKVIGVESGGGRIGEWYASIMEHPAVAPHYERSSGHPSLYTRKGASSE